MTPSEIRCLHDLNLQNQLLELPVVQTVNNKIERFEQENPNKNTRRQLLSNSVRLTHEIAPKLLALAEDCLKKLEIQTPLELYVYSSSDYNAACFKPEDGMLYIMLSSSLIEDFTTEELTFVLGHELGHHLYNHHSVPISALLNSPQRPPQDLALKLFSWSRFAEISADRAGLFCINNQVNSAGSTLFKLSSGISKSNLISFDIQEFCKQTAALGEMSPSSSYMKDWFTTHPFSPLRVNALVDFSNSEHMGGATPTTDLEAKTKLTLSLMEPGYLNGTSPETRLMRDLFIAASFLLTHEDGTFSEPEIDALNKLLEDSVDLTKINYDSIKADLPKRLEACNQKNSSVQKAQVLRDLLLVSQADGRVGTKEQNFLNKLAVDLNVSTQIVQQQNTGVFELD